MSPLILEFLDQLSRNNDREWFQQNKAQYETAKNELESFVNMLIPEIARFDPSVKYVAGKNCLFRIYRDVRFSHDKSPYKINMGAWITKTGKKGPGPGYYIHFQPGESFLAGGVYMPAPDQLKRIRQEIFYNVEEFKSILYNKTSKKYFNGLSEIDKQKLSPREFPKDFPDIDLLKYRHYCVAYPLTHKQITGKDFLKVILEASRAMYPFNRFLANAMEE